MVDAKTTEVARRLTGNLIAVSSASEGVFLYYKFGRHKGAFSEKPYFLLSHCAHVLFTLWRFEEEQGGSLSPGQPRPTASLAGLDFGALRYNDYKRRMLHTDSIEDHWRNETQWFEFWIQILEHYDPSSVAAYREFARCVLACVTEGNVLEGKTTHRAHTAFDRFMKTDAAGSVMVRTLSVLDEVLRGIVQCLVGLDPQTCVLERLAAIITLLNEARRVVIYQTPAKGPYTPLGATRWRAPSPLGRLFWGRTQGVLTVVPRREGGDIICTYDPPPQPRKNHRRTWARPASSLAGTYEQELFATWPYESGECRDDSGHPSDVIARWTLQNEEAGRLETISRRVDTLLEGLAHNQPCDERLIEEVRSISRNGHEKWKAADLPWTYIRRLDELLGKLTAIHRRASLPAGNGTADRIAAEAWFASRVRTGKTASRDCREREDCIAFNELASEVPPVVQESSPLDPAVSIERAAMNPPTAVEPAQAPEPTTNEASASTWCTQRLPAKRAWPVKKPPQTGKTTRSHSRCSAPREPGEAEAVVEVAGTAAHPAQPPSSDGGTTPGAAETQAAPTAGE